jgi:hypothetical protein
VPAGKVTLTWLLAIPARPPVADVVKATTYWVRAPAPGDVWYFPEGLVGDGLTERFQVFNPETREARVDAELSLEQGEAEPVTLTVPAESRVTLNANDEPRIPKNVPHAVVVRSTNGVGVVVERTIDAVSPSTRAGLAVTLGARVTAERWMVAAGQLDDTNDAYLVVHNPGEQLARVSVTVLDDGVRLSPAALNGLEVRPGQRRALRLTDTVRRGPAALLVASNEAVVVERDFYKLKALGTAMSPAIPLRSG